MSSDDKTVRKDEGGDAGEGSPGGAVPIWKRPGARTAVLCVGCLVVGMGLGSMFTSMAVHRAMRHAFREPGRMASRMVGRMRRELDLTDEQMEKILPMVERRLAEVRDTIRRSHEAMGSEMEPLLTPEQLAEHRRISAERRARLLGSPAPEGGNSGGGAVD